MKRTNSWIPIAAAAAPVVEQVTRRQPKFRLTAPEPLERDIHEACAATLDRLLLPPAVWISLGIGALQLTPAQTARLVRVGVKAAWPDLLIVHRHLYGLELKRHGGRLSKTRIERTKHGALREVTGQQEMFPRLLAAGFAAIEIAYSVDDLLRWLDVWRIPHRRAV